VKPIIKIDEIDVKIIRRLIKDARSKFTEIANECGISSTAIKNRIKRMEKASLIIKPVLNINMGFFGCSYTVLIGINLKYNQVDKLIKTIKRFTTVFGIDKTIGKYDLCLFAAVENLNKIDELKYLIGRQTGVKDIEVNIWNKFVFNYDKIEFIKEPEIIG